MYASKMAPPFGNTTSLSTDLESSIWDSLPPLDSRPKACGSFFEDDKPIAYALALVDEAGEPVRAATEADLVNLLEEALPQETPQPESPKQEAEPAPLSDIAFKQMLAAGPVCRHCGVTGGHLFVVARLGPGGPWEGL